jgi:hypothetical protein
MVDAGGESMRVRIRGATKRAASGATSVVLLVGVAVAAAAQSPGARTTVLQGVVRDSATGHPMEKTSVCASVAPRSAALFTARCGMTDSTGAYRVDSIAPPRGIVSVYCETVRGLSGKHLASDSIAFDEGTVIRRDWVVSSVGCDPRHVRRVNKIFRGHYSGGFEQSEFIPCAADAWFIPGDSLDWYPFNNRRAWVEWRSGAADRVAWPRVKRDEDGYPRYFVRWRGTVVGPGRYGHMGVSAFEIRVDSVLELRAPKPGDCR